MLHLCEPPLPDILNNFNGIGADDSIGSVSNEINESRVPPHVWFAPLMLIVPVWTAYRDCNILEGGSVMGCKSHLEMLSHIAGGRDYLGLLRVWYYCVTPSIKGAVRRGSGLSTRSCDPWGVNWETESKFLSSSLFRQEFCQSVLCPSWVYFSVLWTVLSGGLVYRLWVVLEHLAYELGTGVRSRSRQRSDR